MQKMMALGLGLIAFGCYRQFVGSSVSSADQMRCEQLVRERNDVETMEAVLPMCSDPGMVAMMDAQAAGDNAQAAAQRISGANQSDINAYLLDWALIGAGLIALASSAILGRRRA